MPRFAELSVIADMQPAFCCAEEGASFDPANAIPSDRWQSLERSGATLAFSSDWPCTWPPSPIRVDSADRDSPGLALGGYGKYPG